MSKEVRFIILNALPVFLMIWLIPYIQNDYSLTLVYILIAGISFAIKRYQKDFMAFALGFFIMIVSEYLFISTGVETFNRNSLFGLMPLWLPFLWAYGFVVIKRLITILSR